MSSTHTPPATGFHIPTKEACKLIRKALKERSGKGWSVRHGSGTAYGWIRISAPPRRLADFGYMSEADRTELAQLLGLDHVHQQGVQVADSTAHYWEYIDRARGVEPEKYGERYWD